MERPKHLKGFDLYVDGRGHAGRIEDIKLPDIELDTDEFRAGGMDAAVDVDRGMKKLEGSFKLAGVNPEISKLFGKNSIGVTARGSFEDDDGTVVAMVVDMRVRIRAISRDNWSAGERPAQEYSYTASYYKETVGGATVFEIDIANQTRIIGGTDQLAGRRKALGR